MNPERPARIVEFRLPLRWARHASTVSFGLARTAVIGVVAAGLVTGPALLSGRDGSAPDRAAAAVVATAPAAAMWPAADVAGAWVPDTAGGASGDLIAALAVLGPLGQRVGASNGPGTLGIPAVVLAAYKRAERSLAASDPSCGLPWWLLAGIGRIESGHAAGGRVDASGTTLGSILGPRLDGALAGTSVVRDSDRGRLDGDATFDRAVGPMQFLPGTWAAFASDGNGDGRKNPHNVYDAALAAGRYLCSGSANLRTDAGQVAAVLRYNHSTSYVTSVLGWGRAYRDGATSVPSFTGPVPGFVTQPLTTRTPTPSTTTASPTSSTSSTTTSTSPTTSTTTSTSPTTSTTSTSPTTSTTTTSTSPTTSTSTSPTTSTTTTSTSPTTSSTTSTTSTTTTTTTTTTDTGTGTTTTTDTGTETTSGTTTTSGSTTAARTTTSAASTTSRSRAASASSSAAPESRSSSPSALTRSSTVDALRTTSAASPCPGVQSAPADTQAIARVTATGVAPQPGDAEQAAAARLAAALCS